MFRSACNRSLCHSSSVTNPRPKSSTIIIKYEYDAKISRIVALPGLPRAQHSSGSVARDLQWVMSIEGRDEGAIPPFSPASVRRRRPSRRVIQFRCSQMKKRGECDDACSEAPEFTLRARWNNKREDARAKGSERGRPEVGEIYISRSL